MLFILVKFWNLTFIGFNIDETSTPEDAAQITDKRQDDDDDDDSDDVIAGDYDGDEDEDEEDNDAMDVNLDEARLLSMTDDNKSGIVTELVLCC